MGSCQTGQQATFIERQYYNPDCSHFIKSQAVTPRFGNIQKLKLKKQSRFKYIMSQNQSETVVVECPTLTSLADAELYEGCKFTLVDQKYAPLIDICDRNTNQIYHNIRTEIGHCYLAKIYPFVNDRDIVFKKCLYQISLYKCLDTSLGEKTSQSALIDYYILSRGKMNSVVLIFKYYTSTLFEIIQYRRLTNFNWTQDQVVMLWYSIFKSYLELHKRNIFHRDIRPGKVFYNHRDQLHYQFVNLQSARKINDYHADDVITVQGVDHYCQDRLKNLIQSKQQIATYDARAHDRYSLATLMIAILKLDPLNTSKECNHPKLGHIIKLLLSNDDTFGQIERQLSSMVSLIPKEVRSTLFNDDKNISDYLQNIGSLPQQSRNMITQNHLKTLLNLHKKQQFQAMMIEKIELNEKQDKKQKNVEILHTIGEYYQKIGISCNDYYKQEIILLLQLCEEFRKQYFYNDHHQYFTKAKILFLNYQPTAPKNLCLPIKVNLLKEETYDLMQQQNNQDKIQTVLKQLLALTLDNQLDVCLQMEVLILKIIVEINKQDYQNAENTIDKALQVTSQRKNFQRNYDFLRYRGEFQYLKGFHLVEIINRKKNEYRKKDVSIADNALQSGLSIFKNLPESPTNTISIIKSYLTLSSLYMIRQQYSSARSSLQNGDILYREMKNSRTISPLLSNQLLEKLKLVYQKQRNTGQAYDIVCKRLKQSKSKVEVSNLQRHKRLYKQEKKQLQKEKRERKRMMKADEIKQDPMEEDDQ